MENKKITIKELLKNRILWRVYLIWFLRRILPLIAAQAVILGVTLKIFAGNVFFIKVLKNGYLVANMGYWSFFKFLFYSFLGTRPLTQAVMILGLAVTSLIIRDFLRMLLTYKAMHLRSDQTN